jgi:GNAT superfamily N-acetyltransferase
MTHPPLTCIDAAGAEAAPAPLTRGEALHTTFRPNLAGRYAAMMATILDEGARLTFLVDEGEVRALALWRYFHTTYAGYRLEVDDLVTDESQRSKGYGATLLSWLEAQAAEMGCDVVTLNSATHRAQAHRFYFRQRYGVFAFHFVKALRPAR